MPYNVGQNAEFGGGGLLLTDAAPQRLGARTSKAGAGLHLQQDGGSLHRTIIMPLTPSETTLKKTHLQQAVHPATTTMTEHRAAEAGAPSSPGASNRTSLADARPNQSTLRIQKRIIKFQSTFPKYARSA